VLWWIIPELDRCMCFVSESAVEFISFKSYEKNARIIYKAERSINITCSLNKSLHFDSVVDVVRIYLVLWTQIYQILLMRKSVRVFMLLTCIREVLVCNRARDTDYVAWICSFNLSRKTSKYFTQGKCVFFLPFPIYFIINCQAIIQRFRLRDLSH
jgi:hypothetical protein